MTYIPIPPITVPSYKNLTIYKTLDSPSPRALQLKFPFLSSSYHTNEFSNQNLNENNVEQTDHFHS